MRAIQILMDEHQNILRVLDALETFNNHLKNGSNPDLSALGSFADFFQQYADKFHHAKEEDYLFVEMANVGYTKENGPVGAMLYEHEEGRRLVSRMKDAAQLNHPLDANVQDRLVQDLYIFPDLLRGHIMKEDQILYPMAINAIDPATWSEMEVAFDQIQNTADENGQLQAMTQSAKDLLDQYPAKVL
jgi:hemerythrin-like domain-containing protein